MLSLSVALVTSCSRSLTLHSSSSACLPVDLQVVFAAADIVVAWQLWRLGQLRGVSESRCVWSMLLWLYNPFTATISTRGSCDSLVTVMLLATLLLLLQGQRLLPALLYGLAVHFRIFPIVYAPGIVLYLAYRQLQLQQLSAGKSSQPKVRERTNKGMTLGGCAHTTSMQGPPRARHALIDNCSAQMI